MFRLYRRLLHFSNMLSGSEPSADPPEVLGVLSLLGGSGDLVSKVISTLIGVISNYKYNYLIYNPSY